MGEQVLGRYVSTEASKGATVVTRHITEVIQLTNDHIVVLWCPVGENNLRVGDNDTWFIRIEGFEPNASLALGWFVGGNYAPGQLVTTNDKGVAEVSGTIGDLIANGLPTPNPDGSSMLSVQVADYRSEPVRYVP